MQKKDNISTFDVNSVKRINAVRLTMAVSSLSHLASSKTSIGWNMRQTATEHWIQTTWWGGHKKHVAEHAQQASSWC